MFRITNATGGYGKTVIIRDVSLHVASGEVVALLGRNGVGKSTLMRYATGLIPSMGGQVEIDGHVVPPSSAKRAQRGLGYVPQGRYVFPRMTVIENIAVAAESNGHSGKDAVAEAFADFPLLKPKSNDLAGGLSGGSSKFSPWRGHWPSGRLSCCSMSRPKASSPQSSTRWPAILKRINAERGIAILVAEQDLDFCLSIADRAYVMEKGSIRLETDKETLKTDKALQQELLGV